VTRSKTPEEILAGYVEAMGEDLGKVFRAVSSELVWTHWRWRQCRTLFGVKHSRIELLNEAAPFFFYIVEKVLFDDTLLAIARLIGPPQSVGKSNLTIQQFPALLADQSVWDEVCPLIEKAKSCGEFAVQWRNRRLAHRDLELSLGVSAQPLPPATPQKIDESLSALGEVLDHIEFKFCGARTEYANSPTLGDAESLLYVMRDGLLRRREEFERLKRGEIHDAIELWEI
jgi:hypothetical protein